jgi:hypothetical protein
MNSISALKNTANSLGKSYQLNRNEILDALEVTGLAILREKYGFRNIIVGYNYLDDTFQVLQAPVGYSFSDHQTYLHLGKHGFLTAHKKKTDELEYFGVSVSPITGFWRWFILNIKGVKYMI